MLKPPDMVVAEFPSRSFKDPALCGWRWAAFVAVSLVIGAAIYSNVILDGVFVIDDFDYIVNNPATSDLRSFRFDLHELRIVGYLTFALNRMIGGLEPTWYHAVNVAIHISNSLLVSLLVSWCLSILCGEHTETPKRLTTAAGWSCGLLFLVHPLQTQAVSYVSQRFTSLATLFYLVSITSYIAMRRRTERGPDARIPWSLWGLSAAACVLGMRTKEIAFTVPFAIALVEGLIFTRSHLRWRRFVFCVPYAALLLVIPLSLFAVEIGLSAPTSHVYENMRIAKQADLLALSPYIYFITQLRVLLRYLSLFLVPVGLRAQHDFQASESMWEPGVLAALVVLLAMAGLAAVLWHRSRSMPPVAAPWARLAAFGFAWFFITASVESSFIPIKHLVFEHRMYLPSVGLFAASVGLIAVTWLRFSPRALPLPWIAAAVLLIAVPLGTGTYFRNRVWTDPIAFWSDVIEKPPGLLAGWHNRAVEHRNAGNYELALADLDRGVSHVNASFRTSSSWPDPDLNPENVAKVYGVRAKLLTETGQWSRAERDFFQVLAVRRVAQDPDLVLNVLIDIADSFRDDGSCELAIPFYTRILESVPGSLDARYHRGWCIASLGRLEEGLADLDAVLQTDPMAAQVYFDRATIHRELHRLVDAQQDLEAACRLGFEPACNALRSPGHAAGGPQEPATQLPERKDHGL